MENKELKNVKNESKKVKKSNSVILSDRDIKILEFILEMKFVNLENIFERFFKVNLSGELAKSNEGAIRRLQQLTKAGYLTAAYSFSERKKYYLATQKGQRAVAERLPELETLRPSQIIDHQTFQHDYLILQARIMLENQKAATSWISDKRLRTNAALAGGFVSHNVPDAVYVDAQGRKVAFEFELTQKSKEDYRSKIRKYISVMRSSKAAKAFEKVIYVCAKDGSYEFLKVETGIYGELFEIKRMSEFFRKAHSS